MTRTSTGDDAPRAGSWTLTDVPWHAIDRAAARANPLTYYLVTAASFVETGADLYAGNLAGHVDDADAQRWLKEQWEAEELRHGEALRKYVETVWPEVDWAGAYAGFFAEYSSVCTQDALDRSQALEMVARCVVEVGTSTLYTTLQRHAPEPVLRDLAHRIRQDEVRHYNHFRTFFDGRRRDERVGRLAVLRKLRSRLATAGDDDAYIAYKHAWIARHPGGAFRDEYFHAFMADAAEQLRPHYPYRMAAQMLAMPLRLPRSLSRLAVPLIERAARRAIFA
jgi:ferritin-like protein